MFLQSSIYRSIWVGFWSNWTVCSITRQSSINFINTIFKLFHIKSLVFQCFELVHWLLKMNVFFYFRARVKKNLQGWFGRQNCQHPNSFLKWTFRQLDEFHFCIFEILYIFSKTYYRYNARTVRVVRRIGTKCIVELMIETVILEKTCLTKQRNQIKMVIMQPQSRLNNFNNAFYTDQLLNSRDSRQNQNVRCTLIVRRFSWIEINPAMYDGRSGTKINSRFSNSIIATAPMYTEKALSHKYR